MPPLVDPSGPRWVKDHSMKVRAHRRPAGLGALVERLFQIMFGWLR